MIEAGVDTKKLTDAKRLISKIYTSPAPSLSQVIGQKLLQLSTLKFPSGAIDLEGDALNNLSVTAGEVTFEQIRNDNSLQVSLNRSLERLTDIFEETLLDALKSSRRVFVTFDRIDEAWDSASFESSQRIIAGLIGAAESISGKFKGALRPVIFLREDIFETIDLNDKNKLRSDCGQLLAWTKDGLTRMILERVNFFARRSNQKEFANIEHIFDREQMRQQREPFDYIMLRTMLRPRDFIKLFQLVKDDMRERKDNPFDSEIVNADKLECKSIYNAEPSYSEWLIEELKDEWRAQFPRISELLSAIQNNGKTNFTSGELYYSLKQIGSDSLNSDVNYLLKFLFDNSIIGFKVGKSQQWRFKCFFKSQGFVESDLYKVHDGLHRGLNLTESRAILS